MLLGKEHPDVIALGRRLRDSIKITTKQKENNKIEKQERLEDIFKQDYLTTFAQRYFECYPRLRIIGFHAGEQLFVFRMQALQCIEAKVKNFPFKGTANEIHSKLELEPLFIENQRFKLTQVLNNQFVMAWDSEDSRVVYAHSLVLSVANQHTNFYSQQLAGSNSGQEPEPHCNLLLGFVSEKLHGAVSYDTNEHLQICTAIFAECQTAELFAALKARKLVFSYPKSELVKKTVPIESINSQIQEVAQKQLENGIVRVKRIYAQKRALAKPEEIGYLDDQEKRDLLREQQKFDQTIGNLTVSKFGNSLSQSGTFNIAELKMTDLMAASGKSAGSEQSNENRKGVYSFGDKVVFQGKELEYLQLVSKVQKSQLKILVIVQNSLDFQALLQLMASCALRFPEVHVALIIRACTNARFFKDLCKVLDKRSFLLQNLNIVADDQPLFRHCTGHMFYMFNVFDDLLRFAPVTELQTLLLRQINLHAQVFNAQQAQNQATSMGMLANMSAQNVLSHQKDKRELEPLNSVPVTQQLVMKGSDCSLANQQLKFAVLGFRFSGQEKFVITIIDYKMHGFPQVLDKYLDIYHQRDNVYAIFVFRNFDYANFRKKFQEYQLDLERTTVGQSLASQISQKTANRNFEELYNKVSKLNLIEWDDIVFSYSGLYPVKDEFYKRLETRPLVQYFLNGQPVASEFKDLVHLCETLDIDI